MILNYKGLKQIITNNYIYVYFDSSPNGLMIKEGYLYKVTFSMYEEEAPQEFLDPVKFLKEIESNTFDRAIITYITKLANIEMSLQDLYNEYIGE